MKWALEHSLGLVAVEPTPVRLPTEQLTPYTGRYETIAVLIDVTAADGRLSAAITVKPEAATVLREQGEDVPEQPPIVLALLEAGGDTYVVDDGDAKGMKGYFTRAEDGRVDGVHLGGRLATRSPLSVG